jgi:hypothetical protein
MSVTIDNLFIGRLLQTDALGKKTPLLGMLVDVFLVTLDANASPTFTKLTKTAAKTDDFGLFFFLFTDPTKENMELSAAYNAHKRDDAPPHTATDDQETITCEEQEDIEEFRKRYPHILSNGGQRIDDGLQFAYKVTALIETEDPARTDDDSLGISIIEVMDERFEPERDWGQLLNSKGANVRDFPPFRLRRVLIPASNTEAAQLVGDTAEKTSKPELKRDSNTFSFLGVGRALWEEIGGFAESRPEFIGKTGYFRSANTWATNPNFVRTLFPDRYDAPFAGSLSVQGVFAGNLTDKPIYYSVTLNRYTGDLSKPFDPSFLANPQPCRGPLYANFFEYFSPDATDGKWKSEHLGPLNGTLNGRAITVHRRRLQRPANVEYWPNPLRIAEINAHEKFPVVEDGLWVLTVRAFEQIGGSVTAPVLQEISLDASPRSVMALVIDTNRAVPRFDKLYPTDQNSYVKLQLVSCTWDSGVERYSNIKDVTECNEVEVTPGQINGNEGIRVRFTIGDKKGQPHKHWSKYELTAEYTPRSTSDSPDKKTVELRRVFAGTGPLDQKYELITPFPGDPTTTVNQKDCVLVPVYDDGWPPEKGDPHKTPCIQYGVGLQLEVFSRQTDGCWDYYKLPERTARYIVLRNGQVECT